MQKLFTLLYQLQKSINSLKIDFQLLERVKIQLNSKNISEQTLEQQIKLLLFIYDLSNNQKLYTLKKSTIIINQMALQLKIILCQLMATMIVHFQKQQSFSSIPIEFLSQAIEIMILSTRICLNQTNNKFLSQLQQYYKYIHSPFDYVAEFLTKNTQFLHHINVLELMRFKCQNQNFSILDFQKRLAIISSYEEFSLIEYQSFTSNIVMEIILKSLKNGKLESSKINDFLEYLQQESQKDLTSLIVASNNSTKNIESSSEFLEIYNQIKNYGIENINFQFLEEFIKNEKNFNDQRIFQVAALTLEPDFLEIWFHILNNKKEKSQSIQKGFLCYIYLIESILSQSIDRNNETLQKLVKLSNTVIITLLTEKKASSSHLPILSVIKTLMKVLTELCFSLYQDWKIIHDFGQKIVLVCSRFQWMQISKVIYTLLLYCSLMKKQRAEDIYQKFVAYYNNQQSSQLFKTLSSAYLFRNLNQQNINIQQIKNLQLFRQPFILILFAQNDEDMTIFQIDMNDFMQINSKFLIYSQSIKKYQQKDLNLKKIIEHLENFVLKTKLDDLQKIIQGSQQQKNSFQNLLMILILILEQKQSYNLELIRNPSSVMIKNEKTQSKGKQDFINENSSIKICFVLINLLILSNSFIVDQLKETSNGVLLNKFSQKIKLITGLTQIVKKSHIKIEAQLHNVCCCYLIMALQKFKRCFIKKDRIGQPGQIFFIYAISQLVSTINYVSSISEDQKQIELQSGPRKEPRKIGQQSPQEIKLNFINFIIFEIDCLTNNHEKYLQKVSNMTISQLRTYSHSFYIPKILKQKILRRIVRQNLLQNCSQITLRQFKQIIEITQDQQELQLYMKYVVCSFGEQGRKMLLLLAHENKRLQKMLLKDTQIEI